MYSPALHSALIQARVDDRLREASMIRLRRATRPRRGLRAIAA